MKKIIGLTGTIGSGKSTASLLFKELGWKIVDADDLAREAVLPGSPGLNQITQHFGDVLASDGTLNRKALGAIVFSDPKKKKILENILHPLIRSLWLKKLSSFGESEKIMYVVPLLYETGREKYTELEKIINVSSSKESALKRIISRDSMTQAEAEKRLLSQIANDERNKKADFILNNDSTLDDLRFEVTRINQLL